MKVLALSTQSSGVGYYRFTVPLSGMKFKDVEVKLLNAEECVDFEVNVVKALKTFKPDVVHIGYVTNQEVVGKLLGLREWLGVPFITDIDDDILNVPAYNTAYPYYHGAAQARKIARMQLRVSDSVSVSTPPLAAVLASDCKQTTVLPNCLRASDWESLAFGPSHPEYIRILFSGNMGRYGDLLVIREALESLMNSRNDVQLLFMGCVPDWATEWMKDVRNPFANRAFSISTCSIDLYMATLKYLSPDILIAPVDKNEFNKSKSHIKAYDAAMINATLVCTDWPTYGEVPNSAAIKLDNSPYQWHEALTALIDDPGMRFRLSARLKEWAFDSWTIDKHAQKWVDLYSEVSSVGPITSIDQIVRPA